MKGRSEDLIKLRNAKLILRYVYWTEIARRRTDDVWKILSEEEFFLSEVRIQRILADHNEEVNKLIEEARSSGQQQKAMEQRPKAPKQYLMFN